MPQLTTLVRAARCDRYVEPFAGSAALFFALRPKSALLADINHELIDMYRAVKADVELVLESFDRIPIGKDAYYALRAEDVSAKPLPVRAARFLYLNRYCFNGLFRTNRKGEFNVPYGPPKRPLRDFACRVRDGAEALGSAALVSTDFEETVGRIQRGDLVYLDPPYAVDERRIFREYVPGSFSTIDVPRLRDALTVIDKRGATFILSYAMSEEAQTLLDDWNWVTVHTRRNVAGFAGHRRSAEEVLISNRTLDEVAA